MVAVENVAFLTAFFLYYFFVAVSVAEWRSVPDILLFYLLHPISKGDCKQEINSTENYNIG